MTKKEVLQQLSEINDEFCSDADELRWEVSPDEWTKVKPANHGITEVGWLRSVMCNEHNQHIFVLELDARGLNDLLFRATISVSEELKNITGITPVMKASGKAGAHVYQKLLFPKSYSPMAMKQCMENLAQTLYIKANLSDYNISIGRLTKKELGDKQGFVDMCMYDSRRMLRAFSIHPHSRMYSVPFTKFDKLDDVRERMLLLNPVPRTTFPSIAWNPGWKLEKYELSNDATNKNVNIASLTPELIARIKTRKRGDDIYNFLPKQLKVIVNMKTDITHELKVPLIEFLHYELGMSTSDIREWLTGNVLWSDFNPNSKQTLYHIQYTVDWVDKIVAGREFDGPQPDEIPVNRWAVFQPESEVI